MASGPARSVLPRALYRGFPQIGAVAHTHSACAAGWAQARRPLPCLGTTHADVFYGEVPCTAVMRDEQIRRDYEEQTAVQIIETFQGRDYQAVPGVLVARMNLLSLTLTPDLAGIKQSLLDKHYLRKHGKGACYGQRKKGARGG